MHGEAITTLVYLFCDSMQSTQESKQSTTFLTTCIIRLSFKLGGDLYYQCGRITARKEQSTNFSECVLMCYMMCVITVWLVLRLSMNKGCVEQLIRKDFHFSHRCVPQELLDCLGYLENQENVA